MLNSLPIRFKRWIDQHIENRTATLLFAIGWSTGLIISPKWLGVMILILVILYIIGTYKYKKIVKLYVNLLQVGDYIILNEVVPLKVIGINEKYIHFNYVIDLYVLRKKILIDNEYKLYIKSKHLKFHDKRPND